MFDQGSINFRNLAGTMSTMGARLLVVVSGLPASGKTTVGRALSHGLSLPLIDKDDILEAMFDSPCSTASAARTGTSGSV